MAGGGIGAFLMGLAGGVAGGYAQGAMKKKQAHDEALYNMLQEASKSGNTAILENPDIQKAVKRTPYADVMPLLSAVGQTNAKAAALKTQQTQADIASTQAGTGLAQAQTAEATQKTQQAATQAPLVAAKTQADTAEATARANTLHSQSLYYESEAQRATEQGKQQAAMAKLDQSKAELSIATEKLNIAKSFGLTVGEADTVSKFLTGKVKTLPTALANKMAQSKAGSNPQALASQMSDLKDIREKGDAILKEAIGGTYKGWAGRTVDYTYDEKKARVDRYNEQMGQYVNGKVKLGLVSPEDGKSELQQLYRTVDPQSGRVVGGPSYSEEANKFGAKFNANGNATGVVP